MSIEALISRFGIDLHVYEPVYTTQTDGTVVRTFGRVVSEKGFVQPSSQSEPFVQGRQEGRTNCQIFFMPNVSVPIDAEIRDAQVAPWRQWRVTGSTNPGELETTGAAPHLSMTVVDAVQIEPDYTLEIGL